MRNLKRVFSLVMMVAMLCSVMAVGAGAAYKDFTDKDKITHTTAVETLVSLGVINGKDNGTYDPMGSLTRGEAAKLICVVLNGGKAPVLGNPDSVSYKDTADSWASPYIEYCTSLGIIAGDGNGYFRPNNTVTASQLSKMLLVALGYDAKYEGLVGSSWAAKTDALANQTGLYDSLSNLVTSQVLNRDNAAQIIYNVLTADLVSYPNTNNNINTKASSTGQTVLERYFNASEVVGYVAANDVFGLDNLSKCADGKTRIAVDTVNGVHPEDEALPVYTLDVSNDLVGQKVSLYVKNYGKTTAAVIGSPVVSTDNKVVTANKGYASTAKLTDFLDDNNLTLPSPVAIYLNGVLLGQGPADAVRSMMGNGIETRFIDNDGDGTVDMVLLTQYALTKVTAYNTSSKTISFASGDSNISFDDVVDYASYAKGDYVLYCKFNDTYYLSKVNTVSGTPSMFTGDSKLVIDGTEYAASALQNNTNNALVNYNNDNSYVNNSATFYLDAQGNIIATGDYEETSQNYALILASNAEKGTLGGYTGTIKMLKDDGSVSTYTVNLTATATKYLNAGVSLNYYNGAYDALNPDTNKITVTTGSSTSNKQTGMAVKLAFNSNTTDVTTWNNTDSDKLLGQIVTYTVNSDGTVTIAPTTANGTVLNPTEAAVKTDASYSFDGKTVVANSNTIYFFKNGDTTSVVKGLSSLASTSTSQVTAIAYAESGSSYVAKAAYVTGPSNTSSQDYVYVIKDADYHTNDDGNVVYDYTVAKSDGTTDKVSVLDENNGGIVKGNVYSLSYENGYAILTSDATDHNIYNNATVNYNGNGTIAFTNAGGAQTMSVASDATVVSVENAADSLSNVSVDKLSSISEDAKIAVSLNSDGQIQHIYIIDYDGIE